MPFECTYVKLLVDTIEVHTIVTQKLHDVHPPDTRLWNQNSKFVEKSKKIAIWKLKIALTHAREIARAWFLGQNRKMHRLFLKISFRLVAQFLIPLLVIICTAVEKSWFLWYFSCFLVVKPLRISNCDFFDFSTNFEFWFQSLVPGGCTSCNFCVTIV